MPKTGHPCGGRERHPAPWPAMREELGLEGRDFDAVAAVLAALPSCEPPPGAAETTVEWLASVPRPGAFRRRLLAAGPRPGGLWWTLAVLRSQTRVFSFGFWAAAALVSLIATLVTLYLRLAALSGRIDLTAFGLALPFGIISPVIAALGVSYALRSLENGPWEVELSCPITPTGMAMGRFVIVLAYVTGLSLVAALVMGGRTQPLAGTEILTAVVTTWLAPVLFLGAVSLYASLRFSPLTGTVVSLGLWAALLTAGHYRPGVGLVADPGQAWLSVMPAAMLLATVALLLAASRAAGQAAERAGRAAA